MDGSEAPGSSGFGYQVLLADGSTEAVTWLSPDFSVSGTGCWRSRRELTPVGLEPPLAVCQATGLCVRVKGAVVRIRGRDALAARDPRQEVQTALRNSRRTPHDLLPCGGILVRSPSSQMPYPRVSSMHIRTRQTATETWIQAFDRPSI